MTGADADSSPLSAGWVGVNTGRTGITVMGVVCWLLFMVTTVRDRAEEALKKR